MENQRKEKITIKLNNKFILPINVYLYDNIKSEISKRSDNTYEFEGLINKSKIIVKNLIQSDEFIVSSSFLVIERSKYNYGKLLGFILFSVSLTFFLIQNNLLRVGLLILIAVISLLDFNNFLIKDGNGNIISNNIKGRKKIKSIWDLIKNGV